MVIRARLGGQSATQSCHVTTREDEEIGKWNVEGLSRDTIERGLDIGKEGKC